MKRLTIITLLLIIAIAGLSAAAPAKPVIRADKSYYDVNSGLYILKGHVYIEFRDQIITAGQARANMATMEIWGTDGVTLAFGDIRLSANAVQVISSQNRAVIDSDVLFRRPGLVIAADNCDFNWATGLSQFRGHVRITQGDKTWTADSLTYNLNTDSFQ